MAIYFSSARMAGKATIAVLTALVTLATASRTGGQSRTLSEAGADWPAYGHDSGGTRYSLLKQIDRSNVGQLQVAWTYRTGDMIDVRSGPGGAFEATPILVDGTLYL